MQFRTEISPAPLSPPLTFRSQVVLLGSCFTTAIGSRLQALGMAPCVNPLGTVFNPLALQQALAAALGGPPPPAAFVTERQVQVMHHGFHSSLAAATPEAWLGVFQQKAGFLKTSLQTADWLVLTLGTARSFFLENLPVGNCHRRPAAAFTERMLTVPETAAALAAVCRQVRAVNPGIALVLTVSPVRHLGADLNGNSLSKATLRLAAAHACQTLPGVQYFPAYELLLDDLRDYRFYADDLLHPAAAAEKYIFGKFVQAAFSPETRRLLPRYERYLRGLNHRPVSPESAEYRAFQAFLEKEKAFFSRHKD